MKDFSSIPSTNARSLTATVRKLICSLLFVLLGLLIIVLVPKPAKAELSPQQFQALKSWAQMQDYPYQGLETYSDDFNRPIYYWRFGSGVSFALVLTSVSSRQPFRPARLPT
jgi:hypothetical protein